MDSFKQSWFRYDASPASTWLQASIVNLATAVQFISKDGRKAVPHLGGTGKNPGGTLLLSITTKTYPALIDPGKPDRKAIGPLIRGMILRISCTAVLFKIR